MDHDRLTLTGDHAKKFVKNKVGTKVTFTVTGHLQTVSVPIEKESKKKKGDDVVGEYHEEPRVEVHILSINVGNSKLDTKEDVEREIKKVKEFEKIAARSQGRKYSVAELKEIIAKYQKLPNG